MFHEPHKGPSLKLVIKRTSQQYLDVRAAHEVLGPMVHAGEVFRTDGLGLHWLGPSTVHGATQEAAERLTSVPEHSAAAPYVPRSIKERI